jgi:hypothetical protein
MTIYALNTNNLAISEYAGITFPTLVEQSGSYYGINSNGIYKFTGNDDSGVNIDAYIETGFIYFNTKDLKRFRTGSIYLLYHHTTTDTGTLTFYTSTNGVDDVDYYDVPISATYPAAFRPQLWDGMRGLYWKFKIANTNGAPFKLEYFYATPYLENRAIK